MKRSELEHIIRAACTIADDPDLVVLGSQAVLAQFPDAPVELLTSMEADVYPKAFPERAALVEGAIGELSMFHETFGYYAQAIDESIVVLPVGWKDRLVPIRGPGTLGKTGWALEVHDIVIGKYVANREKDRTYVRAALRHGLVEVATLKARLAVTPLEDAARHLIAAQIDADL